MTWFKFLSAGAVGTFSGYRWPTPDGVRAPGEWVVANGRLDPCRNGLHACRPPDLPFWLMDELYTVELDEPFLEYDRFVVAGRARLLRRVDAWGQELAGTFSTDCVWRLRDLAVDALRASGHGAGADRLADRLTGCTAVERLVALPAPAGDEGDPVTVLLGYLADAAGFTSAVRSGPRWSTNAATVGFVAATAARVAGGPSAGTSSEATERSRQSAWLADHLLAAV